MNVFDKSGPAAHPSTQKLLDPPLYIVHDIWAFSDFVFTGDNTIILITIINTPICS